VTCWRCCGTGTCWDYDPARKENARVPCPNCPKGKAVSLSERVEELRRLEALASPAPWASVGHELYFSHTSHQQIGKAEDAHLIAAMRNLLKELLDALSGPVA
jgi:hypothetical protein